MCFECRIAIGPKFKRPANLDVVFKYSNGPMELCGVESKFTEPFGKRAAPVLKDAYFGQHMDERWSRLPRLRKLATLCRRSNLRFQHLDVPQLIKHVLALSAKFPLRRFRLLYLYFDVPGEEACRHRQEISEFQHEANLDSVQFTSLSYQELILNLRRQAGADHRSYLDYLSKRYL